MRSQVQKQQGQTEKNTESEIKCRCIKNRLNWDTNWVQVKGITEWQNRKQDYGGHRGIQDKTLRT